MNIIGVDGIGGDLTEEGSPCVRAIRAVSQVPCSDIMFKIALADEPRSKLPPNVEWFKAGSIDEAISQFSKEGIPAVTALNVQKGIFSLIDKRIKGIRRIPFAAEIPHAKKGSFLFLDVGVNSDLYDIADSTVPASQQYEKKARDVADFARLGSLYMELYRKIANPRICLLSNGAEESKGNAFVRKCHEALKRDKELFGLNYTGFAEPADTEKLDVLVTDGYTGNIGLKFIEATIDYYKRKLGILKNVVRMFKMGEENSRHTGAFVLGLSNNFVIVKIHGAAKAKDFATAYRKAADFSKPVISGQFSYSNLSSAIEAEFSRRYSA